MTIFVRPARAEDSEKIAEWFVQTKLFESELPKFPNAYTLCAFVKEKIIGFLVMQIESGYQVALRFIPNPEASELEKASGSFELIKQVIFLSYTGGYTKIYFEGSDQGTNRIASHKFKTIPANECQHIFENTKYPVYVLELKDLE